MTATANTAFTAAQFNTHVRDNLNETAPAKATAAGRWFISTGANTIAERAITTSEVVTLESTTSTSYTDLTTGGPAVTLTTGTKAMVIITSQGSTNTADSQSYISFAISGATTLAATDDNCLVYTSATTSDPYRASMVQVVTVTAGSNTFTLKYRSSNGAVLASFTRRQLTVFGM
jgi:hypothetical protein